MTNLRKRVEALAQRREATKPALYLVTRDGQTYTEGGRRDYTRAEVDELEQSNQVVIFRIVYDTKNPDRRGDIGA